MGSVLCKSEPEQREEYRQRVHYIVVGEPARSGGETVETVPTV